MKNEKATRQNDEILAKAWESFDAVGPITEDLGSEKD